MVCSPFLNLLKKEEQMLNVFVSREEFPAFTPWKEAHDNSKIALTPISSQKRIGFSPINTTLGKEGKLFQSEFQKNRKLEVKPQKKDSHIFTNLFQHTGEQP